jgi:hypothetical protein
MRSIIELGWEMLPTSTEPKKNRKKNNRTILSCP